MNAAVVEIENLSRKFGHKEVLKNLSLSVPRGAVFGLVGENGAGKSTLIKHMLGLWRAEQGSVRIFGNDPVTDPVAVLKNVGYLSEEPDLPGWMTIEEIMRYTQAFYPAWDTGYADSLLTQFALDRRARIKTLSKGQLAKTGLLLAQAHWPELLLLDEPSSGLDPIVRRDILTAVIRTITEAGRTVFFSSHLLDEIERVSDHVAMLHKGKLVLCGSIDDIKQQHRHLLLRFDHEPNLSHKQGHYQLKGSGRERSLICNTAVVSLQTLLSELRTTVVEDSQASLDEIFFLHAGTTLSEANAQDFSHG